MASIDKRIGEITVDWSRGSTVYGQTFGALICARSKHGSVSGHQGPRPSFAMISPSRQASVIRTTQREAGSQNPVGPRRCLSSVPDRSSPPLKRGPLKRS